MKVKSESEVAQSCPTPSDPMGCSLPGSSIHGIFQTRVLEWGAIAFSAFKQQEEANYKCPMFFLLHTKLKWAFSAEMFFLSYVNETVYLFWNLPFFKMVPPKTNFFSFLKPWADNSSTNQCSCQLFHVWGMTHFMPPYLKNTYCGRGARWNSFSLEVSLLSD